MPLVLTALLAIAAAETPVFYVSPAGEDAPRKGKSADNSWRSLSYAMRQVPDNGATIIVGDGEHVGAQSLSRKFEKKVTVRAAHPYRARFISAKDQARAFSCYKGSNVRFEGLVFTGSGGKGGEYLVHLGSENVHDLTFADCIVHDGYVNDMVKINAKTHRIHFLGCVFYNQARGANHFDINTVTDITLEGCIFFNDYQGSNRPMTRGSAFICAKNSGDSSPNTTRNIRIRRNIFLNYQGMEDQAYVLIGEDAKPFFEAQKVLVENNLFLFTSKPPHIGAFQLKGKLRDITFRANTVSGHPAGGSAYAARMWQEGGLKTDIRFQNNIWSDPVGMADFSDGEKENFTGGLVLSRNLYWNAGKRIPRGSDNVFTLPDDDPDGVFANPRLANPSSAVLPRFDEEKGAFLSGSKIIAKEFERLVRAYGIPRRDVVEGKADSKAMPNDDIFGKRRDSRPDLGAYEHSR